MHAVVLVFLALISLALDTPRQMGELNKAVGDFDSAAIIDMAISGNPSARKQLLDSVEGEVLKIKRRWAQALEKNPGEVSFDSDFVKEWSFVADLKDVGGEGAEAFTRRLDKFKDEMKEGLATSELEATSALSCRLDNRNLDPSQRFRDETTALSFLKRLVKFKVEEGSRQVGKAIMPQDYGARTRDVLRQVVVDFKKNVKRLTALMSTQSPEKAMDVHKIVSCLKALKDRAQLFTESKFTLQYLDSVMPADAWSVAKKLDETDLGSVAPAIDTANDGQEWDPEIWADIDERVGKWLLQEFKDPPDFKTKIKISSDRVLFYQMTARRVAADAPDLFTALEPFVSNGEAKALLSAHRGFQAKVTSSAADLWQALQQKCDMLKGQTIDAAKFKSADYSNKEDPDFQQAKSLMADINQLYDAVKLFKQHVVPCLVDKSISQQMDLQSLSDSLLERVNSIAQQLAQVDLGDLDAISGLLMTMHVQSEELLFQKAEVHTIVAMALENFMAGAAAAAKAASEGGEEKKGEGMGISKLGLRLRDARFRPAGEAVVRGYDAFQGYLTALFNRKTEAQDIGYVTQNIKVDESNRLDGARINSVYKVFDDRYKKEIKKCLDEGLGDSYLVPMIKRMVDSVRVNHPPGSMIWSPEMKVQVPELVALIFAVWTLHHSKKFLQGLEKVPAPKTLSHRALGVCVSCRLMLCCLLLLGSHGRLGQASLPFPASSCASCGHLLPLGCRRWRSRARALSHSGAHR